jgi:O-acetyl-ADP-ribose deacetylase
MPGRGKGKDPNNTGYAPEPNKTLADDLDPDHKLPTLYGNGFLQKSNLAVAEQPSQEFNDKIFLWRGAIETLAMTAIVNAADETLRSNRGVSGAIFARAGNDAHELETLCDDEVEGVQPGDVRATDGGLGDLDVNWIIHAVGPDSRTTDAKITSKGDAHMEHLLRLCYHDSLSELLKITNYGTPAEIAFPAISTGDNGFDHEWATPIALSEVRKYMSIDGPGKRLEKIVFCVFDDDAENSYRHHIPYVRCSLSLSASVTDHVSRL